MNEHIACLLRSTGKAAWSAPVIVAGHYCVSEALQELSSEGEAEKKSFAYGLQLHQQLQLQGLLPSLVLFINDIGIAPDQRAFMKTQYCIPDSYIQLLDSYGMQQETVSVIFESSIRNKASRAVEKLFKRRPELFQVEQASADNLIRCVENSACSIAPADKKVITLGDGNGGRLVIKEGDSAKCNMILATLFSGLAESHAGCNVIINAFNRIYIKRIELGCHVFETLYGPTLEFINVFFDEDESVADAALHLSTEVA